VICDGVFTYNIYVNEIVISVQYQARLYVSKLALQGRSNSALNSMGILLSICLSQQFLSPPTAFLPPIYYFNNATCYILYCGDDRMTGER